MAESSFSIEAIVHMRGIIAAAEGGAAFGRHKRENDLVRKGILL